MFDCYLVGIPHDKPAYIVHDERFGGDCLMMLENPTAQMAKEIARLHTHILFETVEEEDNYLALFEPGLPYKWAEVCQLILKRRVECGVLTQ